MKVRLFLSSLIQYITKVNLNFINNTYKVFSIFYDIYQSTIISIILYIRHILAYLENEKAT